jgi:CDP-diacylglycerol---serine O-phosphatidyltransferase
LLTLLTLFHGKMPEIILPIAFFVICYLMVSTIKIPSLKDIPLPKYGILVTLFLGYAIYLVFKKEQHRFPYFIYMAIPLYIMFISYQLVRIKRKSNAGLKNKSK